MYSAVCSGRGRLRRSRIRPNTEHRTVESELVRSVRTYRNRTRNEIEANSTVRTASCPQPDAPTGAFEANEALGVALDYHAHAVIGDVQRLGQPLQGHGPLIAEQPSQPSLDALTRRGEVGSGQLAALEADALLLMDDADAHGLPLPAPVHLGVAQHHLGAVAAGVAFPAHLVRRARQVGLVDRAVGAAARLVLAVPGDMIDQE